MVLAERPLRARVAALLDALKRRSKIKAPAFGGSEEAGGGEERGFMLYCPLLPMPDPDCYCPRHTTVVLKPAGLQKTSRTKGASFCPWSVYRVRRVLRNWARCGSVSGVPTTRLLLACGFFCGSRRI